MNNMNDENQFRGTNNQQPDIFQLYNVTSPNPDIEVLDEGPNQTRKEPVDYPMNYSLNQEKILQENITTIDSMNSHLNQNNSSNTNNNFYQSSSNSVEIIPTTQNSTESLFDQKEEQVQKNNPLRNEDKKSNNSHMITIIIIVLIAILGIVFLVRTFLFASNEKVIKNANINGRGCFGDICTIDIDDVNYALPESDIAEIIKSFYDYNSYIDVDIYYKVQNKERIITGYKIRLKSNNKDISSVKTENELRKELGLLELGTHTEKLTYVNEEFSRFTPTEDGTYIPAEDVRIFNFQDDKGDVITLQYVIEPPYTYNELPFALSPNNKYTVTFEVQKKSFDDDSMIIKEIK